MSQKFSQELQEDIIRCVQEDYGLTISSETADEFLDSLGEFFLWLNKSEEERTRPQAADALPDSKLVKKIYT